MGKIYVNDLADVLVSKTGINKQLAQEFLTKFAETIQEGISDDKLVKIKGLGTFKVVDVEARESVNVNTGERVTIEGHQKLTFTPDASMKELVNRPFSQFETVVLNDGVVFDENNLTTEYFGTDDKEDAPIALDDSDETAEEELMEVTETAPKAEVEKKTEEVKQEEPQEEPQEEQEDTQEEEQEETTEDEPEEEEEAEQEEVEPVKDSKKESNKDKPSSYWWLWLLLAIVACVICFTGGYLYGGHMDRMSPNDENVSENATAVVKTPVAADSLKRDTAAVDTMKSEKSEVDTTKVKAETSKPKSESESDWEKYDEKDSRVRLGAYGIIGFDRMETVRPGDTTKRIANRTLGEGMECYIEAYNDITTADLKEGQSIKIPKLELKRKLKQDKTNNKK